MGDILLCNLISLCERKVRGIKMGEGARGWASVEAYVGNDSFLT